MAMSSDKPPGGKPPPDHREPTYLESDEEIRQAIEERRALKGAKIGPAKVTPDKPAPPELQSVAVETLSERPRQRPPMGLLCICDDGKSDGEWVRLRADRNVIGRMEGDIRIPHDNLISGKHHAALVREETPLGSGSWAWSLVDLKSTNGTFVRVGKTIVRQGTEFRIGCGHYRFEAPGAGVIAANPAGAPFQTTQPLPNHSHPFSPSLVEVVQGMPISRFHVTLPEIWIGRDPKTCNISRPDDLLTNPRHARLFRDPKGQWFIENQKSINGLWLRIEKIPLDANCQFRLGEQVFLFRIP